MKNIIAAFLLILTLTGCVHKPEPQTLPPQFLGYWPPIKYPTTDQGPNGVDIRADGTYNSLSDANGKVLYPREYKFICSPDPDAAFIIIRGNSPSDFNYYGLSRSTVTFGEDKGVQYLDIVIMSKSLYAPSLKEWNNPQSACPPLKKSWEATTPQFDSNGLGNYWRKPH